MNDMNILSFDTTAKTVSVCAARKNTDGEAVPLALYTSNGNVTHSETLLPMIDRVLSDAGLCADDIGLLAVSAGPGSFTGVRIGTACAKGISFSLCEKGIPHKCASVSSLEALAQNAVSYSGYLLCPVMDARRSQFYNALFRVGTSREPKRLCEDRLLEAKYIYAELLEKHPKKKILLVGDGAVLCKKLFDDLASESGNILNCEVCPAADRFQNAFSVALCGVRHIDEAKSDASSLSPSYLRASQAERERLEMLGKKD